MKLLLVTILFCLGTIYVAQEPTSTPATTYFNGFHCDGKHGLCTISNEENRTIANTMLVLIDENNLSFRIDRSKLSDSDFKSIFNTSLSTWNNSLAHTFKVPERMLIQQSLANRLQSKKTPLYISSGNYPIKVTTDHFIISFNLE